MPTVEILVTSGSGNGRAVEIAHRLFRRLAACGYAGAVRCFASADDVRAWARRCPPTFSHLLCVGGDATMSAAAGAAVRLAVPLIPVPCGFGNIFARALGDAVRADSIVDLIEHGPVRRADIGLAGEDIFLSHRSYGLLEDVQGAVERGRAQPRSRPRRLLAYCSAMAGELLRRMPLSSIDVEVDGTRVAENSALVTVANVETYRGFLTLTPNATPFDGLLDICILPPTSRPRLLARLMILALKLPGRWTGVRLLRGRRVTVTARGRAREDIRVGRGALPLILRAGRGRSGADGAWDRPPESRAA
jgi:diacylglycerol kinase (ATP)